MHRDRRRSLHVGDRPVSHITMDHFQESRSTVERTMKRELRGWLAIEHVGFLEHHEIRTKDSTVV